MPAKARKVHRRPPTLDELIHHAGEVKRELVQYGLSGRFASEWSLDGPDTDGLDESLATMEMDRFILQHRLAQGGTLLERFARMRRSPSLSPADRAMLLGWSDVVEGVFEVTQIGDGLIVRDLLDDLDYSIRATAGPQSYAAVRAGMFLIARIVPLGHGTDVWLLSGHPLIFPADAVSELARTALDWVAGDPTMMRRNPRLINRALEMQDDQRRQFIDRFGSDVVILPPAEAEKALHEFHAGLREKALASSDHPANAPEAPPDIRFPDDMMDAETIGIVFDEADAMSFYWNLGVLDEFLADPTGKRASDGASLLRGYLEDDSINASVFRHLAQRHPETVDRAFRVGLELISFSWDRDGEALLTRYKGEGDPAGTPRIGVVGERLGQLLRG